MEQTKPTAKTTEDRAPGLLWRVLMQPDSRWGAAFLWLWAASLGVGVGILWGVWAVREQLRLLTLTMEGR